MLCALRLAGECELVLFERNDRLGKKLSATGNGQGNVTNVNMGAEHYFSDDLNKVAQVLSRFSEQDLIAFLEGLGGLFLPDSRGRVYPAGRQASAITDLLRAEISRRNIRVLFGKKVTAIEKREGGFTLSGEDFKERADCVVLCAGGMAAPNFGTDGNSYALAKSLGHTVTACTPSLVQLRCDPSAVRGLKGIRVDGEVSVVHGSKEAYRVRGDVLFTESGVSGDAIFRASAHTVSGDTLYLDFLPDVPMAKLKSAVFRQEELLCLVNNGLGRVISRRAGGDKIKCAEYIKRFPLTVTGTLGFAYAQVTKGGIPLAEVDENLMSKRHGGLFFAGELLNVDGECGGYNLQWAFSSAFVAAEGVIKCFSN